MTFGTIQLILFHDRLIHSIQLPAEHANIDKNHILHNKNKLPDGLAAGAV